MSYTAYASLIKFSLRFELIAAFYTQGPGNYSICWGNKKFNYHICHENIGQTVH